MRKGIYKMMGMLSAAVLSAGTLLSTCLDPVLAEPAEGKSGTEAAVIDIDRECSLTIYKYDTTKAGEAGIQIDQTAQPYGEASQSVQDLLRNYQVEGVEFSYLYCGDVKTYVGGTENKKEIGLVYQVPNQLCSILDLRTEDAFPVPNDGSPAGDGLYYSTSQINDAWRKLLLNQTGNEGSEVYDDAKNKLAKNILEDYLEQSGKAVQMPLTDADGKTSVSHLKQGLYLIVETKVPENVTETVNPWFVTLPFTSDNGNSWKYDITCYPKNQTGEPTLDKLVRDANEAKTGRKVAYEEYATASEGEKLDYILVSKIPHIQSKATWLTEYTFSDLLSPGLTYGRDAQISFFTSREDAYAHRTGNAAEVWNGNEGEDTLYVQEYGKKNHASGKQCSTMTVSMTSAGLKQINENYSDYWMVISYTATMKSDDSVVLGDGGNENDVSLLWRRTSNNWYDTLEDDCLVFSYGVDLEKQFSDGKGDPGKAEFLVQYTNDKAYLTARMEENQSGERIYYVTGRTLNQAEATRFIPASNGKCEVYGLRADSYEITEEKTDRHYQLLSREIGFQFQQTRQTGGTVTPAKAVVDGQNTSLDEGKLKLLVVNYRRVLLPETGGNGVFFLSLLGIGLVVLGCSFAKRKSGNLK